MRQINGLSEARWAEKPRSIPNRQRHNPAAAKGLVYQRKLGKALDAAAKIHGFTVLHGPWIEYRDHDGLGVCQPDFIVRLPGRILVIEAKLTFVQNAILKLQTLYIPLVMHIEGRLDVQGTVVCQNVTAHTPETVFHLDAPGLSQPSVYHWLGRMPIAFQKDAM